MKKVTFLTLFLLISFFSSAQLDAFRTGVVAGFSPQGNILKSAPLNGGLMAEIVLPVIGIGAEVDLIYENKAFEYSEGDFSERFSNFKLPMYVKWRIGIPMLKGFIGAGATYSLSWQDLQAHGISKQTFNTWSFSAMLGVEVLNKIQVRLGYDYQFLNSELKNIFKGNSVYVISLGYWL